MVKDDTVIKSVEVDHNGEKRKLSSNRMILSPDWNSKYFTEVKVKYETLTRILEFEVNQNSLKE
jgi:hypothetical protein